MIKLTGEVTTGYGLATSNLAPKLPLIESLMGIYNLLPGTLNIKLNSPYYADRSIKISKEEYYGFEEVYLQRCKVAGIPCILMRPQTHEEGMAHGPNYLEIMSDFYLRSLLNLNDGEKIVIEIEGNDEWWSTKQPPDKSYLSKDDELKSAQQLHLKGNLTQADILYKRVLSLNPKSTKALSGLGTLKLQQEQDNEAIELLTSSLSIDPNQPTALSNLGVAFSNIEEYQNAIDQYRKAIQLKPKYAEALHNLGNCLRSVGEFDEALKCYHDAVKIKPNYHLAFNNRGLLLQSLGHANEALADFDRAIKINSQFIEAILNKADCLKEMNLHEDALKYYDKAIDLRPDDPLIPNKKGVALKELGRLEDAITHYNKAISIDNEYAPAYWNKSIIKILQGNFIEGWKLYEWRWKWRAFLGEEVRSFKEAAWLGQFPIQNKILLIHAEQGLGDTIQFCRYLKILNEQGASIIFEVNSLLFTLIKTIEANNLLIIKQGDPLPPFDCHCSLFSLPFALNTTLSTIPAETPYLSINQLKNRRWQKKLGIKKRLRVGIAWSGSKTHNNDKNRSIPLDALRSLLELNVDFFVLQKDISKEDSIVISSITNLYCYVDEIDDFSDTAALMQEMDLIISVDTSVAHLAGALAKDLWLLLPYMPDYRWLLNRDDSPWYASAKLFRQPQIGDWAAVIDLLLISIKKLYTR